MCVCDSMAALWPRCLCIIAYLAHCLLTMAVPNWSYGMHRNAIAVRRLLNGLVRSLVWQMKTCYSCICLPGRSTLPHRECCNSQFRSQLQCDLSLLCCVFAQGMHLQEP